MNVKPVCVAIILCGLVAGSLFAAEPDIKPAKEQAPAKELRVADQAVMAQLDRRLPEINFSANSFVDVIDFLRDVTGANIYVNWKAMESAGIAKDAPITARLRDVPFRKALETILEDAGGTVKLVYRVDEGVISISPVESAKRITRSYDVHELLPEKAPPVAAAPAVDGAGKPVPPAGRADALIKLLTMSVVPETWEANGGTGTVKEEAGKLVISQTMDNHEAVNHWLELLKAAVKK